MNIYINVSKTTYYWETSVRERSCRRNGRSRKNLGISVITVENAYAQLVAEGYLYSMPKRGFYAADLEIEDSMRDAVPKEILQVANGETSYFADFSSNQTDSEIFPVYNLDADGACCPE